MAKQSPTDKRFRCNKCKDYYSAPLHTTHYQCPAHGYLCNKHVIINKGEEYILLSKKLEGRFFKKEVYSEEVINLRSRYIDCCKKNILGSDDYIDFIMVDSKLNQLLCLKKTIKFNWNTKKNRWIEEGKEGEIKKNTQPNTTTAIEAIRQYAKLRDDGIITEEEFQSKKKELLEL